MQDSEKQEHDVIVEVSEQELDTVTGSGDLMVSLVNAGSGVRGTYRAYKELGYSETRSALKAIRSGPTRGIRDGKDGDGLAHSYRVKEKILRGSRTR